jgi:hypothetical protein
MTGVRHGMCELTRYGMAGERHGYGIGAAWHLWISLKVALEQVFLAVLRFFPVGFIFTTSNNARKKNS